MGKALNIFLVSLFFSVQVVIAASPIELVLDKQSEESPDNNRINDVQFGTNGSIAVIGSQGRRLEVWNIGGGGENRSFKAALLDVKSAKWVGSGHTILISSPLRVTIWNAEKVELINEVQTGCLDGWPIATLPSGLSAWEDVEGGKAFVTVQNLVKPDRQIRLKLARIASTH